MNFLIFLAMNPQLLMLAVVLTTLIVAGRSI